MISEKLQNFFGKGINQVITDSEKFEKEHDRARKEISDFKKEMSNRSKNRRLLRNR